MSDAGVWRCRRGIVVQEIRKGDLVEAVHEEDGYVENTVAFRSVFDPRQRFRMDAGMFRKCFEKVEKEGGESR